jgi:hypothetical protein
MLGFRNVELNIDSIVVVNVIKADKTRSNMRYSLVKSINKLLYISHSYRKIYWCADALTNVN